MIPKMPVIPTMPLITTMSGGLSIVTYLITFEHITRSHSDYTFDYQSVQTNDGLYKNGIDKVYVKNKPIKLKYAHDTEIYNMTDISLGECWLCTDPNNESTVGSMLTYVFVYFMTQPMIMVAVFFSASIDADGLYHIDAAGIDIGHEDIDSEIYDDWNTNDVRFGFLVPLL